MMTSNWIDCSSCGFDREHVGAYLETHTEAGVRFYQRHGFQVRQAFEVPGAGLTVGLCGASLFLMRPDEVSENYGQELKKLQENEPALAQVDLAL